MATIPFLQHMGETTGWFTNQDLTTMIAVSESTPGPLGVNMATYVGYQTAGVPGALVATLGVITPGAILILIIAGFLQKVRSNRSVEAVFAGLRPASTALIAAAGLSVAYSVFTASDALSPNSFPAIQWTAGVIFSLLIIFVILISSFEIVLYSDMSVYRKEYEKYEVLDELDMTMDDAMYVTREMMDYLRGDKETLSVITEVEGKRQDFFNEQDRFHMREVRDIFAGGLRLRTAALVAAAVSLLILYMCRADVKKILPQTYQVAVGIVLIPTAGIGIAAAIDFNSVFVQFHNIFFDNDLWLFDPAEDFMIRMLPEGLFYDMAFRVGSLFAGILVILFLLSLYMRWRENSRKVKEKTGKKKND